MKFEADNIPVEKLPNPVGWRMLIAPVKIENVSKGGIVMVDDSVKMFEYFRNVAKVLAMGPSCYEHPKYQGGIPIEEKMPKPWCKVGDIIQYSTYTGIDITLQHEGVESKLRYINDDEVLGVIKDFDVLISI